MTMPPFVRKCTIVSVTPWVRLIKQGQGKTMLKKQFLKSKPICKVTFSLPAEVQGETAFLVGDFNNWDEQATEMKRLKSGSFTITLDLDIGRDYQFRYLVNGSEWHNDWEADRYVPNPYSGDNSVISTTADSAS